MIFSKDTKEYLENLFKRYFPNSEIIISEVIINFSGGSNLTNLVNMNIGFMFGIVNLGDSGAAVSLRIPKFTEYNTEYGGDVDKIYISSSGYSGNEPVLFDEIFSYAEAFQFIGYKIEVKN